jgi:hypothetical protein
MKGTKAKAVPASTKPSQVKTVGVIKKKTNQVSQQKPTSTKLPTFASSAVFAMPITSNAIDKHLFLKLHRVNSSPDEAQEEPTSTLFVSNISTEEATSESFTRTMETLFHKEVEHVHSPEENSQRIALVTFSNPVQESSLLKLTCEDTKQIKLAIANESSSSTFVSNIINQYQSIRQTRFALAKQADEQVLQMEQDRAKQLQQENEPIVDDDGFTLVVSKKPAAVVTKKPKAVTMQQVKKKPRIMDESLSFYKFERKRLGKVQQVKLKDQFKLDIQKAERLKNELLLQS